MILEHFVDFFTYIMEMVAVTLCFCWRGMERKKNFRTRCAGLLLGSLALCILLALVVGERDIQNEWGVSGAIYLLLSLPLPIFVFFCFLDTVWNRVYCCVSGMMLRMVTKKLCNIAMVLWELRGFDPGLVKDGQPLNYLLYYPILTLGCIAAWFLFGKTFRQGGGFSMNGRTSAIYFFVLTTNLIMSRLEYTLLAVDIRAYGMLMFCEFAYCSLILCAQTFLFQIAQAQSESRITQELWRQDRRQYDQIKESIEIVNIKCHDLRHQLRAARESGQVDPGFLREVEKSISIYDSSVKSGNETLDVILTDRRLHCEAAGIQLTCMTDGKQLDFMERSDIISLFSNLLENAMEYETTVPEEEKRFISLTVRSVEQFLNIHIENYFEGELVLRDGLLPSQKRDKTGHGYGIKSIRQIVEKYGGTMKLQVEDGMFQVNILIPH